MGDGGLGGLCAEPGIRIDLAGGLRIWLGEEGPWYFPLRETTPDDMVRTLAEMYAPVFGDWAVGVFVFGAFVVLYSTFFVNAAGNARMASDALVQFGVLPNDAARQRWVQRLSVVWPLVSLALYLLVQAPVAMILAGGLAQAIMLPILGGAALFFRHRRSHPHLRPSRLWDVCLLLSCVAFLIVAGWSVVNLLI